MLRQARVRPPLSCAFLHTAVALDATPGTRRIGIYQTIIAPGAVLAPLQRRGEGPLEIIVDPLLLGDICQIGPLRPQRQRPAS